MEINKDLQIILDFLGITEPTERDLIDCVMSAYNILNAAGWDFTIKSLNDYNRWELTSTNRFKDDHPQIIYNAVKMTPRVLEIFIATVADTHIAQMQAPIPTRDT
jgi:hypothetical protein